MFGNYIKSMPKLNDAEERKKKSLKPGPAHVTHKYTRGSTSSGKSSSATRCQKCENYGHFTYNCPVAHAPYKARPSRTQQLLNPKASRHVPSVEVPEEFLSKKGIAEKILAANELERNEAQSKLVASKSSKKKIKAKASSSSSSSSDSDSTSDSDSDSDSDSSSTSSSSSGDSSDSSSASDSSSSSSSSRRRVRRRPASPSSSTKSSVAPRRHRHRSRSVSRKPVGSRTPPSPRPRDLPRSREPVGSPAELVDSRAPLSPPRKVNSRSNIGEYSRDRDQKTYPVKSSAPPRRHHHRSRSVSRGSVRSRTPPSPRRNYSPDVSYRPRSPRIPVRSRASPSRRRGSRLGSRSPRRRVSRPNSGHDSRDSSRDRPRKINAAPARAYRDRSRSLSRESVGCRTPPSPRRRYSPHRSERRARSPLPPIEPRASMSPERDSNYHSRSGRKVMRPESGYDRRGSLTDRHRKKDRTVSPDSPRRHRPRPRSVSRESVGSRTPSPERRHSPYRSHERGRSPRHSIDSRAPPSPRQGLRPSSRSPRRKASRPSYEYDPRGSARPRR